MTLPNVLKPWYVYRPGQIVRRVARTIRPAADPVQIVELPWGCPIEIDIRETVGRSIWTTGVYDLAVAEVLFRLTDPAALALDVGANIGALTGLLASRAAEVWAFEPHPVVHGRLAANVARFAGRPGFAPCRVFDLAVSDADGTAGLAIPAGFEANQGLAQVSTEPAADQIPIRTARLDDLLGDRRVGLMKMDVEGHEPAVLRGAARALADGRITHVVFEDHVGADSPVYRHLAESGYSIFALGWRMTGPRLTPAEVRAHRSYEAASYLATRDPAAATTRCRPGGWQCFSRRQVRGIR